MGEGKQLATSDFQCSRPYSLQYLFRSASLWALRSVLETSAMELPTTSVLELKINMELENRWMQTTPLLQRIHLMFLDLRESKYLYGVICII